MMSTPLVDSVSAHEYVATPAAFVVRVAAANDVVEAMAAVAASEAAVVSTATVLLPFSVKVVVDGTVPTVKPVTAAPAIAGVEPAARKAPVLTKLMSSPMAKPCATFVVQTPGLAAVHTRPAGRWFVDVNSIELAGNTSPYWS